VSFWTWTCIKWLRQEPYVRAWSQACRDDGLVVIGVHTPELSFEHDVEGVRRATAERAIDYPVAVDDDYAIWNAFANRYWPALYFADSGRDHPRRALRRRPLRAIGARDPEAARCRARARVRRRARRGGGGRLHLETPETYLGYWRATGFVSSERVVPDEPHAFRVPQSLPLNHWALAGEWRIGPEKITLEEAGGTIALRFRARDAHLVLLPGAREPIPSACASTAILPARQPAWTSTRTATASSTAGGCTSSSASTSPSATARWRSRSSSRAPRPTRSRSDSECGAPERTNRV